MATPSATLSLLMLPCRREGDANADAAAVEIAEIKRVKMPWRG
jgi:hypothetical protein